MAGVPRTAVSRGTRAPSAAAASAGRRRRVATPPAPEAPPVHPVDSRFLESLIGYNARRAALAIIALFLERMAPHALRPVDFSVLSLVTHNPGITSRQICATLGLLPPNLVSMVDKLEARGMLARAAHPSDGRATSLHLTQAGVALMRAAEQTVAQLEAEATARLSAAEQRTLVRLLQKIYRAPPDA